MGNNLPMPGFVNAPNVPPSWIFKDPTEDLNKINNWKELVAQVSSIDRNATDVGSETDVKMENVEEYIDVAPESKVANVEIDSLDPGEKKFKEQNGKTKALKELDHERIARDLYNRKWEKEFETEKILIPQDDLYNIWEHLFLSLQEYKTVQYIELANLGSGAKKAVLELRKNRKLYITSLTNYILTAFRPKLTINDRFMSKCFEHELDTIIFFILENQKFFNISITTDSLIDLLILLSIDYNNVVTFARFSPLLTRAHLEYAIHFASFDFLLLMWKMRRYIPNFDKTVLELRETMKGQEWKQHKFFEWCRDHYVVV